jgi:hypothetical protein
MFAFVLFETFRDYNQTKINRDDFLQEEEKYVQQVLKSHSQIKEQILAWADFLADMYDAGNYEFVKSTICAHISSRLMVEGWTEGETALVRRILPPDYKNDLYDRYSQLRSNDRNQDIYGDFDQIAKGRKTKAEMRALSNAEFVEFAKRRRPLNKEYQKRLREENKEIEEIAEEKRISLDPDKESRDKVPEWMHEITELYTITGVLKEGFQTGYNLMDDVQKLMKEYAPDPETCRRTVSYIKRYLPTIYPVLYAVKLFHRGFKEIVINYSDEKYSACASDWLKIGIDQIVNAGSHGSGVINAIRTGEWVFRPSKDPNFDMIMIPLEREFTREQVGDKTAKDLLVKARNILIKDQVEKAFMDWSKNTVIDNIQNTPEDYWKSIKH